MRFDSAQRTMVLVSQGPTKSFTQIPENDTKFT